MHRKAKPDVDMTYVK